uniref:Uncharacterized protein n=1 Tax=Arundo donax TaxID=35708 RepID=A0A0A9E280_ARUDO
MMAALRPHDATADGDRALAGSACGAAWCGVGASGRWIWVVAASVGTPLGGGGEPGWGLQGGGVVAGWRSGKRVAWWSAGGLGNAWHGGRLAV